MVVLGEENLGFDLTYEIIIFILCLASMVLNLLVLYITKHRYRTNKAIDTQLMILISVFDLLLVLFCLISQIIKWCYGANEKEFLTGPWCRVNAIAFNAIGILAVTLTAQLAAIRYLTIVKRYAINNMKSSIASIILVVIITLAFILSALQNSYRLMPSGMFCITISLEGNSITHIIYAACIFLLTIPSVLSIPIFYGLLSLHYYRLNQSLKSSDCYDKGRSFFKSSYIVYLLLFTIAYLVSLLPEFILLIVEAFTDYQRTFALDCIIYFLFFSECAINPLFVITLHPETRNDVLALLKGTLASSHDREIDNFQSLHNIELNQSR
ncbi:family A G protein-coupled receptor-like protein [Neoconidiobolus thromboides FSU 785]|nr:family A G protein-coupled receptor-like protein [Neoconidiobolus thromboides FSU 785]